jgi:hypothetical protein
MARRTDEVMHSYLHLFFSLNAVSVITIKEEKWIYVTN